MLARWVFGGSVALAALGACGESSSSDDDDSGAHAGKAGAAARGGTSGRGNAGTAGRAAASGSGDSDGGTAGRAAGGSGGSAAAGGAPAGGTSGGDAGASASGASGDGAGGDDGGGGPGASHFIDVAPGDNTTCAISAAHELYCWGFQDNSQPLVGDGTIYRRSRPVRISDFADWTDVESGALASCALRQGELWCWGGVDPLASSPGYRVPTRVGTENDWEQIGIGRGFVCGIRTGGAIWCFGGDPGFNYATDGLPSFEPLELTLRGDIGENLGFEQLSVGRYGGCAIRESKLYCWGTNLSNVGVPARFGEDADWESISAGDEYACGIRGGDVYCWGQQEVGETGNADPVNGTPQGLTYPPLRIEPAGGWTSVSAYTNVTCGIRNGDLYCWGMGPVGYSQPYGSPPTRVGSASDWQSVRVGDWVSCGLRGQELYCWGVNGDGAVGAGVAGIHNEPQRVSEGWRSLALGRYHACGIKDEQVTCFGQIPQFFRDDSPVPEVVTSETDWRTLSAAYDYTCGLRGDNAFCWGDNLNGRLGTGDDNSSPSPWGVGPVGNWSAISSTDYRTCGIREGELYCWGDNHLGFLGDGTEMTAKAPVRIGTATDWDSIALGQEDTCGTRAGKLYCWGRNQGGTVGTGDKVGVHEPVQIGTAANWSNLTMGLPSCGLRDGALYCWGPLSIGAAGDDPLAPTRIGNDADWTAIATYSAATCGLRNGGELYCWGADFIGQLAGATAPIDRFVEPIRIGDRKWDSIALGYEYFCGTSDGTLFCWGNNEGGKLGIGPADTVEPMRVEAFP